MTEKQRAQWSSAADGWERWTDWLEATAADVTRWIGEEAGARPGTHLLDLACGGGEPAATLAARVSPEGRVVATDFSPDMVDVARRRATRLGRDNLTVRIADAQALPFDDASFDAVTCRFGLMLCPEPDRAALEIRRVLRPGGRFAVAVWDLPERNPFFLVLMGVLAKHIEMPPADPKAPGPYRLAPPGELENVFTSAGFTEIRVEPLSMVWRYESPEQYWRIQLDLAAPLRTTLAALPESTVERIRDELFEHLPAYRRNGFIELPAMALGASGTR